MPIASTLIFDVSYCLSMSVGVLSMYPMTLLISLRPNVLYISEQSTSQVIFDDWPSTEGDASFIDFLYPPYRFVGKVWAGVDACAPTATPTTSPPSGRVRFDFTLFSIFSTMPCNNFIIL